MYRVRTDFRDLRDGGYEYHAGDAYPREGMQADEKRVRMLSEPTEQRDALIEIFEESPKGAKGKKKDAD